MPIIKESGLVPIHSVWGGVLCLSNKLSLISIGFVSSLKNLPNYNSFKEKTVLKEHIVIIV